MRSEGTMLVSLGERGAIGIEPCRQTLPIWWLYSIGVNSHVVQQLAQSFDLVDCIREHISRRVQIWVTIPWHPYLS